MHYRSFLQRALFGKAVTSFVGSQLRDWRTVAAIWGGSRRWRSSGSEGVISSPHGTMEFPEIPLHECIYENMGKWEKKVALECTSSGRKYTYAQMRKASKMLAASMRKKLKLVPGDVAALFLPNVPEYPIIFLAGSEAGITLTTINSTYKHEEIAKQINNSEAKIVITMVLLHPLVELALQFIKKSLPIAVIKDKYGIALPPGTINFMELLEPSTGHLKLQTPSIDANVVLPYSSGTMGLPKGVQLSHRNIVSNILQTNDAKHRIVRLEKQTVVGILPMFHIYGMTVVTFSTLHDGGRLLTLPKFDPKLFIQTIVWKKATVLYLVPPLILFITNHPLVKPQYLKSVRCIINGASPIGAKDMEKLLLKKKNLLLGQGYGMTETSPVVLLCKNASTKLGGTGVPVISTEVKIVDPETSKPQPARGLGEIWVKGPQVMKGYLNNPAATKETIVEDGWLKTGDIAYYDEEGEFFIVDRLKDLIKVKGFQVAPAELEELLRMHPKVLDAAVVGISDPLKGEVPKAFIVLKQGETATEEEIKEFIKSKVAPHKELAGGVAFIDVIPKSAAGKILKKELV